MREGIKTSLLSIVCAMAVSTGAYAAASVRSVGGAGTYPSAASAATSTTARAGSLRTTGGSVRTTPGSGAAKVASGTMPATTTSVSRAASAPRLSIGKYVGVPKAISQQGSGSITENRIQEIERQIQESERQIEKLETEKQIVLKSTRYIDIVDNEVMLNTENLIQDLEIGIGEDGREIELDADNNDGIKWRYVARDGESENAWTLLVSWPKVAEQIGLTEMNEYFTEEIRKINTNLNTKVDKEQGVEYAGQVLMVDATGHVTPGVVYSTTDVDQFIHNIGDDLDTKVDKAQGVENKGKVLVVGNDGNVTTGDVDIPDVSGKVDVAQGSENAGKLLLVNNSGNVDLSAEPLGDLAYKDKVSEEDIMDGSVTRAKAAEDIAGVLDWAEWWKTNSPGENALLSVDADGNQQWFFVAE